MKTTIGSRFKVFALTLLIIAMLCIMYNPIADIKYWIAFIIIVISLGIINYDYFILYKNKKKDQV